MGFFTRRAKPGNTAASMLEQITIKPATIAPPADHDQGWEYLYFASELKTNIDGLAPDYDAMLVTSLSRNSPKSPNPFVDVRDAMTTVGTTVGLIDYIFQAANLEKGFGKPGEPGDEAHLSLMARQIAGIYANLLNVAMDLKSTNLGSFQKVGNDVAASCLQPLQEIRAFSDTVGSSFEKVVVELRQGIAPSKPLVLTLTLTMDEAVSQRLMSDLELLKK